MKELPILMKGPMVRAILDGTKTMTRRIIKPKPEGGPPRWSTVVVSGYGGWTDAHGRPMPCPYGAPGDRLGVKESHYLYGKWKRVGRTKTGKPKWRFEYQKKHGVKFPDNPPRNIKHKKSEVGWFKRSSLFMPKWAIRIWLEVVNVRVERLKDISHSDAIDEGCAPAARCRNCDGDPDWPEIEYAEHHFMHLWESINGPGSWDANPLVWAISFRRIKP